MEVILKYISAASGVIVSFAFGEWSDALTFLFILVGIDYLSGLAASIIDGTGLNSNKGFFGIVKKVAMFGMVAIAHWADNLVGTGSAIMMGAIFFYCANELLSIFENYGRMNLPVPNGVREVVSIFREKSGESDANTGSSKE